MPLSSGAVPDSQATTATQSGSWDVIPDRPSQKTGRTYKTGAVDNQNSAQNIYTVTSGKTFYCTSMHISAFCYDTSTLAQSFLIKDGAIGAIRISILAPKANNAAMSLYSPFYVQTLTFPEPLQFTTAVYATYSVSNVQFSVTVIGYEE